MAEEEVVEEEVVGGEVLMMITLNHIKLVYRAPTTVPYVPETRFRSRLAQILVLYSLLRFVQMMLHPAVRALA